MGEPCNGGLATGESVIRLAIVARYAIMRRAFQYLCAALQNVDIVAEAGIDDAPRALNQARASAALLSPDLTIPQCLRLQYEIKRSPERTSLITIQTELQPQTVRELVQWGIICILDDQVSDPELATSIALAAAHQPFLSRHVRALLADAPVPLRTVTLMRREREVLGLLTRGESNDSIARHLYVAVKTVEMHVSHLYGKLGVCTRAQAIMRALELGFIDVPVSLATRASHR